MSYKRLKREERRLREEVEGMCDCARQADEAEDARFGAERRGDELPEELQHRERRLEAEQRAADAARGRHPDDDRRPPGGRGRRYKRDFGVPKDKAQSNFTDPESRIMMTGDGYQQCYNGQLVVDEDFQVIVANELTANASDQGVMLGLLDQVDDTVRAQPACVLADAGYRKEDDFEMLEKRGIEGYVSVRRESKEAADIDANAYPATHRMVEKLATPEGRDRYRDRKHIVEAVNGWIKQVLGFRRFSIRGLQGPVGEWDLVCLAANLRRMRPLIEFG